MAGMQKIMIIGNLGRDPEMRYTPNGAAVTSFSVAVTRKYTTSEGQQREETDWFNVSCWNKLAETANQYLTKGKQVYIEGRISVRLYDDTRSGEKRFSMDVRANEMQMLGSRGDAANEGGSTAGDTSGESSADFDNMPF